MFEQTICPDCGQAYLKAAEQPDGSLKVWCEACGLARSFGVDFVNEAKAIIQRHLAYQLN